MKLKVSKIMLESALIYSAKKDVRYYLNGVCFKPDGVFASTDGHRLFCGSHNNDLSEEIIISNVKSPTKAYAEAIFDTDTGIVDFNNELGMKVGVAIFSVLDGKYPDVNRILPKDYQPVAHIGFNAGYLASLEKSAKLFDRKHSCIKVWFSGAHNAAVCELRSPGGESAKVILMPMRVD